MAAIPYRISQELAKNNFNFPFQVYRALHDVLISGDGIGFLAQYWTTACRENLECTSSHQAIFFTLRHVAFRTFQFQKVLEFVRVNDIIKGMPTIGISGVPCKESTIKRVLGELSQQGFLIKLRLPRSRAITPLYGFNLPQVLDYLNIYWDKAMSELDSNHDIDDPRLTHSTAARRTKNILECLCKYFQNFSELFDFLSKQNNPISDITVLMQDLKGMRPRRAMEAGFDFDVVSDLKSASRVRHSDLIPNKWKNPVDVINGKYRKPKEKD